MSDPGQEISGVLVMDKPPGPTSAGFSRQIGRILGVSKVGHTGTLDPFASGVLPICLGDATKLSSYLTAADKAYEAVICLGQERDTFDAQGKVTAESAVPESIDQAAVLNVLERFRGEILQKPPIYSAKKVDGERSYDLARKGIVPDLPEITVKIHELNLLEWKRPFIKINMLCSKGTYVRTLAHDIGIALGTHAYLHELKRLKHGHFTIDQALSFEMLTENQIKGTLNQVLKEYLLSPSTALSEIPAIKVPSNAIQHIRQGGSPNTPWFKAYLKGRSAQPGMVQLVDSTGNLLALLEATASPIVAGSLQYSYLRVFPNSAPNPGNSANLSPLAL